MAGTIMTQNEARDVADEIGAPDARLIEARKVLAAARRPLPGSRMALQRIEEQMVARGLLVSEPVQEAA